LVLLEKGVVDEFFDVSSFIGILLQTSVEEISDFCANEKIRGNLDFVLDDFDKFLLFGDLEGVFPHHHLIHHDADGPNIYFLVVFSSLQDFWTDIERSPAKSGPELVILVY